MPEVSKALLLYRWRRLPQARRLANEAGYAGAMFPWQSSANGREETQTLHLNPASGHWLPDNSHLQRHINVAVAYNTWQYYEATGDLDFLATYGAEVLFEIARFWASIATYDRADDRYDIRNVMGPDEYHDAYPWRDEAGLDNNAYTNVMVVWLLQRALRCVEILPDRRRRQLLDLLDIRRSDLERWEHMSRKMRLAWHDGVLSQFEGYERLKELNWEDYRIRYGDIGRLDRILEAEGDSTNGYRLSKQADVLMLFYLLSETEIAEIIEHLGYRWDPLLPSRCVDFYLHRTAHGSTLSKLVHAWVVARIDRDVAWRLFLEALESDVSDVQGGTTQEGIHLGAMVGTVDLLQRGFTGLETRGDILRFDPYLPEEIGQLHFRMRYREHYGLEVFLTQDELRIVGRRHVGGQLHLRVRDTDLEVDPGGAISIPLD
jgi:trehalose/maltose hydrolase-like predicted phosphorylase